ncbi:MAG: conjugal transfer protein TraR [Desulfovibrio sp.]|nr:conjugal transfer protein TraR [Desulfovibrio sp.]|tara:strand:- start:291 stop:494 length:204 start_codon:yes stop_codon:yes gene_type:complete
MADFCDDASNLECLARKAALANAGLKKTNKPSRETCADCGDVIPAPRRAAIPGVELCITCQTQQEEQ